MFIVELTYRRPIEEVEALMEAHRAWLAEGFADGVLLLAGRKVPREGGMILAHGMTREALDARLAADPFQAVADYRVIEMAPTMADQRLGFLVGG